MGVGSLKTIITPLNKKKDPIVRATKSSFLIRYPRCYCISNYATRCVCQKRHNEMFELKQIVSLLKRFDRRIVRLFLIRNDGCTNRNNKHICYTSN